MGTELWTEQILFLYTGITHTLYEYLHDNSGQHQTMGSLFMVQKATFMSIRHLVGLRIVILKICAFRDLISHLSIVSQVLFP